MNREIKFRGKCKRGYDYSDGTGWVYGSLLNTRTESAIVKKEDIDLSHKTDDGIQSIEDFAFIPVENETVGQFTGLKDKNGKDIYEGDIMRTQTGRIVSVKFNNGIFQQFYPLTGFVVSLVTNADRSEVIGNIHENPELLKT